MIQFKGIFFNYTKVAVLNQQKKNIEYLEIFYSSKIIDALKH